MAIHSKNSRVGKVKEKEDEMFALGKYCAGNVGATWKTGRRKGGSSKLSFEIKRKIRNRRY